MIYYSIYFGLKMIFDYFKFKKLNACHFLFFKMGSDESQDGSDDDKRVEKELEKMKKKKGKKGSRKSKGEPLQPKPIEIKDYDYEYTYTDSDNPPKGSFQYCGRKQMFDQ